MLPVIYICCLDAVDATAYASTVLKIKLRDQQSEARIISKAIHVPRRCRGLDIRSTPEFWSVLITRAATRQSLEAGTITTAVRLRGGEIQKPYDVPASMEADDIEAWLAD